jgi:hypothetical protein
MRSSEFMAAVPDAVHRHLPQGLSLRRGRVWPWGVQLYDDDPRFHYEVSRVPPRLGDRLELGLHFESRNAADNLRLLNGFAAYLLELKDELGQGVEAEPWDRGWTKVYETVPLLPYDAGYLDQVARRLAEMIQVMHPLYRRVRGT